MKKSFYSLLICLFLFIIGLEGLEKPRILIKFPTRGRFDKFFSTLDLYYDKLSKKYPYHFVITCDEDDPVMNNPEAIQKLNTYPHLSYYFGYNKSKIEACNANLEKHLDFDILILASDDMIPKVKAFDRAIVNYMKKEFPNFDGILHFDDGFQHKNIVTLPIMGKKYYERFGYIYHPSYVSLFCDNEMTLVAQMINKLIYINLLLIEHQHPLANKANYDSLYEKNDVFYERDRKVYFERYRRNFDLSISEIIYPIQ